MFFYIDKCILILYNHNMRIFLFVINGLGVGSLPDYSKYDSEYECTAEQIKCIQKATILKKMGLFKCCLQEDNTPALGHFLRGRMLTTKTNFECGFKEILGNVVFDDDNSIAENLIDTLKKHNVDVVCFSSNSDCTEADKICESDREIAYLLSEFKSEKDSVLIAEFNDFAKFALSGNKDKMEDAILFVNDFFASVIGELKYDDVLIASGNFGVNPSKIGITREYNPIFVCSKLLGTSQSLKTIQGNNCIAMSVVELLKIYPSSNSFVGSKLRQKIDNYGILLKNEIIASRFEKHTDFKIGEEKQKTVKTSKKRFVKDKKN